MSFWWLYKRQLFFATVYVGRREQCKLEESVEKRTASAVFRWLWTARVFSNVHTKRYLCRSNVAWNRHCNYTQFTYL